MNGVHVLSNDVILSVSKKHNESSFNETYLWHCRLSHIGEKRLHKLHKEGLLGISSYESYDDSCKIMQITPKRRRSSSSILDESRYQSTGQEDYLILKSGLKV